MELAAGLRLDLETFEKSLGRLGFEYVDLYLIHWPVPTEDRFVETWRAFERIREEGRARTIGVSNFRVEDLERLEAETWIKPTIKMDAIAGLDTGNRGGPDPATFVAP